jgi:hypothetical protein
MLAVSVAHVGDLWLLRKAFDLVRFESNSDDFLFDNQMFVQCHAVGLRIAEITCPTHYFSEASSINFRRSVVYGLGCPWVGLQYLAHRMGLITLSMFQPRACDRTGAGRRWPAP